jgi:hypothetical protein
MSAEDFAVFVAEVRAKVIYAVATTSRGRRRRKAVDRVWSQVVNHPLCDTLLDTRVEAPEGWLSKWPRQKLTVRDLFRLAALLPPDAGPDPRPQL